MRLRTLTLSFKCLSTSQERTRALKARSVDLNLFNAMDDLESLEDNGGPAGQMHEAKAEAEDGELPGESNECTS